MQSKLPFTKYVPKKRIIYYEIELDRKTEEVTFDDICDTSTPSLPEIGGAGDLPGVHSAAVDEQLLERRHHDEVQDTYAELNIPWTKYIHEFPTDKQLAALLLDCKELLFGGALAGGKSSYLLQAALQHADKPSYSAIIFRWQLTDLKQPGALISRSHEWLDRWLSEGVKYVSGEHSWYFPAFYPDGQPGMPARMAFGYIGDAGVKERYQSAEFQYAAFDELTQWPDATDYDFMHTRLRRRSCPIHGKDDDDNPIWIGTCPKCAVLSSIPLRMRAATNPGGPGGSWVKKRWGIVPDPKEFPDRKAALKALATGQKVNFVSTSKERHFIPSFFNDNPHVDTKAYKDMLASLPLSEKSRLMDGNWEVRPDSRFKRTWARHYSTFNGYVQFHDTSCNVVYRQNEEGENEQQQNILDMFTDYIVTESNDLTSVLISDLNIFATLDTAASVDDGMIDDQVRRGSNSWTVMSMWGWLRTVGIRLFMLDMIRFRDEVPNVVDEVIRFYNKWQPAYVKCEYNGTGVGAAQYIARAKIPIRKAVKRSDKIENSTTAQMMMKRGQIFLPEIAPWVDVAESEIFGWTGLKIEEDDIIDTLSDAANEFTNEAAVHANPIRQSQSSSFIAPRRNVSPSGGYGANMLPFTRGPLTSMNNSTSIGSKRFRFN